MSGDAMQLDGGPLEGLWNADDLAKFLRISKSWVYQATAGGRIPCMRIGALVRFEPAVILEWVRAGGPTPRARGRRTTRPSLAPNAGKER